MLLIQTFNNKKVKEITPTLQVSFLYLNSVNANQTSKNDHFQSHINDFSDFTDKIEQDYTTSNFFSS